MKRKVDDEKFLSDEFLSPEYLVLSLSKRKEKLEIPFLLKIIFWPIFLLHVYLVELGE